MPTESPSGRILLDAWTAAQLANVLISQELEAIGVRPNLFALVSTLNITGPITPTDLALETGHAPATLYDLVQALVERGHARREPNPEDGRSSLISLTEDGERLSEAGRPAVGAALARLDAQLDRPLAEIAAAVVELRRALQAAMRA
jgi:DNA-binding MarR family transcriptional regulator